MSPGKSWVPTRKLVPNLLDKQKYVVHYRNLQLYKKHGLVITKVHKIISFTQSAWLRPWIELCNEQRRSAKSDFESDLAKLQANATFGKTMDNVRNRVNIRPQQTAESSQQGHVSAEPDRESRSRDGTRSATESKIGQAHRRRIFHFGNLQIHNVPILLRTPQSQIRGPLYVAVHRHRLTLLQNPDR